MLHLPEVILQYLNNPIDGLWFVTWVKFATQDRSYWLSPRTSSSSLMLSWEMICLLQWLHWRLVLRNMLGWWEKTRQVCKPFLFGSWSWLTNVSRVVSTSRVGGYVGEPMESALCCLNGGGRISDFSSFKRQVIQYVGNNVIVLENASVNWILFVSNRFALEGNT